MSSPIRVVFLGATGAVGRHVLDALLADPRAVAVTALGRRSAPIADAPAKLTQHVVDLEAPASYEALVAGHDVAICTLGVGEPSKLSRAEVWKVDVDYVMGFAQACRGAGVEHFSLMTSISADPASRSHYLRMKGTLEAQVQALGFRRVSLFRPSMLLTPENRYGWTQGLTLAVWPRLDALFAGPLRPYRGIPVEELGRAIAAEATTDRPEGVRIYTWDDFQALLAAR
jgi:uncharacterized protein YbjT (DUF2867 family)